MKYINAALCSFGMSGKVFHAPFLQANKLFNFYSVWERTAKVAATQYPGVLSFDSLEEMLTDPVIDLVIVNTPNYTHFEFAKKALEAGKHVLVEKAFTVTVSEAEELIRISRSMNKKLAVFQNRRYDSDFKTVKKIYDDGVLGKIVEAAFYFDRYNLNLSPKLHKETDNAGAGLLHDLGPHIIDQALYLFGMPEALFAFLAVQRPLSVVNDYFDIMLFYPSMQVRLRAGVIIKEMPAAYSLHGTAGSFVKPRGDIQEDALKRSEKPGQPGWGKEPVEAAGMLNISVNGASSRHTIESLPGNYMTFFDELSQAILQDAPLPVTAEDGLRVMKIIDGTQRSHRDKKVIRF